MKARALLIFFIAVLVFSKGSGQTMDPWQQHAKQRAQESIHSVFGKFLDSANRTTNVSESIAYMNKAINSAESAGIKRDIVLGHYFLGKIYHEQGDTKYARAHFEKTSSILKESPELLKPYLLAQVYYDVAANYSYMSEHSKAMHYYSLSEQVASSNKLDSIATVALRQIGNVYYFLGDIATSTDYYYKSLQKAQALNMSKAIAAALNNIGGNFVDMDRDEEGQEMYRRSLKIAQSENIPELVAVVSNNMGVTAANNNEYDQAIDNFNIALSYAVKNNDIRGKALYYNNLADVYISINDFKRARQFLWRSLETNLKIGNQEGLASNYANLSKLMLSLSKYDSSWQYIQKLESISAETANPSLHQDYLRAAQAHFEVKGDYEKALQLYQKFTRYRDSITTIQTKEKIADLTTVAREREREKEMSQLKEQQSQLKKFLYITIILSVLMISAVIYAFIVQRKSTERMRSQNERFRQNQKELTKKNTELNQSQKMLEEVNRDRNQLFSIISHDLRSPFNSLLGFSEMLIEEVNDGGDEESITMMSKNIYASSMQLFELIQNLLEWANKERGKIEFSPEQIILHKLAADNIKLAAQSAQLKGVEITNEINKHVMVEADVNMLNTIFRNIIFNAVKFTPRDGKVRVFVNDINEHVTVHIKDNGVGMNEEDRQRLIHSEETFTRKGTENEKGAGLGLVLTKDFIKRHHGSFDITTKINEGTTFHIQLPRKQSV